MSTRTVEQRIAAWLADEAPAQVPNRVLEAAFEQTAAMRQDRTVFGVIVSEPLSRPALRIGLVAAAAVIVAVTALSLLNFRSNQLVGGPTATLASYESPRYGYVIGYPEGWTVRPSTRSLGLHEVPWDSSDGIDHFGSETGASGIIVAAEPVAQGTTLEDWLSYPTACGAPTAEERFPIGGEAGVLRTHASCFGLFHLWAVVKHGDSIYQVIWLGPGGSEVANRAVFEQVLRSFAFVD